jgi:hypothetical protein
VADHRKKGLMDEEIIGLINEGRRHEGERAKQAVVN